MDNFVLLLPILFIALMFAVMIALLVISGRREKRWAKINQPTYPADKIERIARAMCAADGRNPDGDGSTREYHTDGDTGRHKWELYKKQAAKFIAAMEALEEPKIPHRTHLK